MDQFVTAIIFLIVMVVLLAVVVLPVVAFVIAIQTRRKLATQLGKTSGDPAADAEFRQLRQRVERLEAMLTSTHPPPPVAQSVDEPEETPIEPERAVPPPSPPPLIPSGTRPSRTVNADQLESIIGRRWLGWIAIAVILFATAFFLKYAFDNRWIGELGRVSIGITFGIVLSALGFKYGRRGWRVFAQILLAGGIVLLYLSTYAAFGYYHLVNQKAAFVYLAILIIEAAALALVYEAPAIAIMALIGGFLTPLLLHSERDQYQSFFAYIIALDVGALALLKRWRGLSSIAYFGTHLLFWLWYDERYHEQKLVAVVVFQLLVFLIFLAAHLAKKLVRRQRVTSEDLVLFVANPFTFFFTTYQVLNPGHHDWMGVLAIGMALVYAAVAKLLLDRNVSTPVEILTAIAVALVFVTIAVPIQLKSNWITIAWAVEALTLLWAGLETRSLRLRLMGCLLFGLALAKLIFWDTTLSRPPFTPVVNRYFLSSLFVIAAVFTASRLYERARQKDQIDAYAAPVVFLLLSVFTLWLVTSIETVTFFWARAGMEKQFEDANHQLWLAQMALSVVWAIFATVLAALGFIRRSSAMRWAALALFALTIVKAMLVDIAALEQIYRIIVFFVLGILLLLVTWGYHKAFQARESVQ